MTLRSRIRTVAMLMALLGTAAVYQSAVAQGLDGSTTIYFVRHAEAGDGDNPDLTALGRARAEVLVDVLEHVHLDAIHSTPLNRTLQTAGPIAESRGIAITRTAPTRTFAEDMASKLRNDHVGQTVLVVSHSNTVPAMINALGGGPYENLHHDEYDSLFVVTLAGDDTQVHRLQYGNKTR